MSSRAAELPGARKKVFIPAGMENYSCNTSSKPTRAATSISWKAPRLFPSPKSIEKLRHQHNHGVQKGAALNCGSRAHEQQFAAMGPDGKHEYAGKAEASHEVQKSGLKGVRSIDQVSHYHWSKESAQVSD